MKSQSLELTLGGALFIIAVAVNLGLSGVGWQHSLIEGHEFRQAQTAVAIRALHREGWSLAYPAPLFGPPWSVPMEFPVYELAVAKFISATGWDLEPAGRVVALAFFYAALPALFLLLRFVDIPPPRRWVFLALVLTSPLYLYYSRVLMIESTAFCLSAWFLYAYTRAIETRSGRWIIGALMLAAAAALAKITTFTVFLVPAAWFTLVRLLRRPFPPPAAERRAWWRTAGTGLGIALVGLLIGLAWVLYSDMVKASNPLTTFLTSSRMRAWNYGALAQRFDAGFWSAIAGVISPSLLHRALLGFLVGVGLLLPSGRRGCTLGLIGCYLAGPIFFANLYAIHDYYHYATGVFLLAAFFVVWNDAADLLGGATWPRYLVLALVLGLQVATYVATYFRLQNRTNPPLPELGRLLAAATTPDQVVLIYGLEWNPVVPYAADRKAIMVVGEYEQDAAAQKQVLGRVQGRVGAVVLAGKSQRNETLRQRLVQDLGLEPTPVLTGASASVLLPRDAWPAATARLRGINKVEFTLNASADEEVAGIKLWRHSVSGLTDPSVVGMIRPCPSAIVTPFGVADTMVEGQRALNAHAPTFVVIDIPAGARQLRADFGISSGAYEGEKQTDGVEFKVEWVQPGGDSRVLFQRVLRPASEPRDRGRQQLKVAMPAGASGQLVLRTLAGPNNDASFDWAYWVSIDLK